MTVSRVTLDHYLASSNKSIRTVAKEVGTTCSALVQARAKKRELYVLLDECGEVVGCREERDFPSRK